MRGISAIVAVVLILLITISLAAGAYLFLSMTMSQTTAAAQQGISQTMTQMTKSFTIEAVSGGKVWVRNTGQVPISNLTIYIDGAPANTSNVVIQPGEVGVIQIYDAVDFSRPREIEIPGGTTTESKVVTGESLRDPSLVGYWKFDEGSGNIAYDSSGYGNNGILNNTATFVSNGKFGGAVKFNGANGDTVVIDNVPVNLTSGARNTVEFWMYWNGGNWQMPFGWNVNYDLYLADNAFGFNTGEANIEGFSGTSFLSNSWHHVVAIFYNGVPSAPNVELWVDGNKMTVTHQYGNGPSSRSVTQKVFISGWGPTSGYKFNGIIDEVRIYNRALTPEEIWNHYVRGPV
jgi:flagellin-like protein